MESRQVYVQLVRDRPDTVDTFCRVRCRVLLSITLDLTGEAHNTIVDGNADLRRIDTWFVLQFVEHLLLKLGVAFHLDHSFFSVENCELPKGITCKQAFGLPINW